MTETTDEILGRALRIATEAHRGQVEKSMGEAGSRDGTPLILHPIRVYGRVEDFDAKVVALLHDVVEDTDVTLEDLEEEFGPGRIIDAIDAITREKEGETYAEYIDRVSVDRLARLVKLADLDDHLETLPHGHSLRGRYERAKSVLLSRV